MKKNIKISDSEWEVMKVIWKKSPLTGTEIVEELQPTKKWTYRTIKTLISRLVDKKIIKYKSKGNTYHYYPILNKKESIIRESSSFINKVFDGAASPMLAHLVKNIKLSKEEIKELKKILNDKESSSP